jgi:glycosyltransferase involved in cell wall biosynthesis
VSLRDGRDGMKLLALPRDVNPYQEYLYRELGRLGVRVRYVGELTGSQTANLLLLPLELLALRLRGWRILHLHWVFGFSFPWARRTGRWAAQLWFGLVLLTCRAIGLRIVWTAHNALPHDQVFANDLVARRWLVKASSLVVLHDRPALEQLDRLGLVPGRTEVIAPGPYSAVIPPPSGREGPPWTLLFFGKVLPYKGVEDLVAAVTDLDSTVRLRVVIAGECPDRTLGESLRKLAAAGDGRVELRLARVADDEVSPLLASCDAVVLPYREVTSSSTVRLALDHARPVLIPDLPAFQDLDGEGVRRYAPGVEGLRAELIQFASLTASALARASEAAAAQAPAQTWAAAAQATYDALRGLDSRRYGFKSSPS